MSDTPERAFDRLCMLVERAKAYRHHADKAYSNAFDKRRVDNIDIRLSHYSGSMTSEQKAIAQHGRKHMQEVALAEANSVAATERASAARGLMSLRAQIVALACEASTDLQLIANEILANPSGAPE